MGYWCNACGTWVPNGQVHACYGNSLPNMPYYWGYQKPQWQRCPVCEGKGIILTGRSGSLEEMFETCKVCEGKKIIDTTYGKPPMF